jgi:hypothetical protein
MDERSIDIEIAEKIMGWDILDRNQKLYLQRDKEGANPLRVPDFVIFPQPQRLLRQQMQELGYTLSIEHKPVNWKDGVGQTFTARFSMRGQTFESTEVDENLAVCCAALKTTGTCV